MVTPLVGVEHGQEASILLVQVGVVTEVVVWVKAGPKLFTKVTKSLFIDTSCL